MMLDLDSGAWAVALREGLGAQLADLPGGGIVACFRLGPFRAAYPYFPVGNDCLDDATGMATEAAKKLGADMVRLQASRKCDDPRIIAVHDVGSTVIRGLQSWNERGWEKARRAANRQSRSPLRIRAGRPGDGRTLHGLYQATVQRHGGAVRYTEHYFELVAPHAAWVAELDGEACGFVCAGYRGKQAFYLHGAHATSARPHYPSDQLFLHMLRTAREAGMESFDFLPTPAEQPSLAAYKRAWGAVDADLYVSDLAVNPWRARAMELGMRTERMLRRLLPRPRRT